MQPFVIDKKTDFKYIRLVDEQENFHDKIFVGDARTRATMMGLSLVCFALPEKDKLALCKIIDYGKWKYHNDKIKKKEQSHKKTTVKELRFSPVISDHDIEHKLKQVKEFLDDGDEVIFSMKFKGIQRRQFALGEERMNEIVGMCRQFGEEVNRKKVDNTIAVRLRPVREK